MSHDHAHGHHHAVGPGADVRWLVVALALTAGFTVAEIVGGLLADSLALLSDAAHMATDAAAIALALWAARLAARAPGGALTFGLKRAEVLSAQVNAVALVLLGLWVAFAAVRRLFDPLPVEGGIVLALGVLGLAVNVAAAVALSRAGRRSLNVEGAFQHTLTDALSSVAAIVAAVLVLVAGWNRADPALSLLVAAVMLRSGGRLLWETGRVLMEAAPRGIDPDEVGRALAAHPGVVEVHDLHVWEVTSGFPALSAHVVVRGGDDCHDVRRTLAAIALERFGIDHTTLQVDHATDRESLLQIEPA